MGSSSDQTPDPDPPDKNTGDSDQELKETYVFDANSSATEKVDVRSGQTKFPNDRLGEYQVIRQLGRGGMGEVYLGYDEKLEREVAIKLLPLRTNTPDLIERFENEARAAAKLVHPHIIPIYQIGEDGEHHFFVMQFVDGYSLAEAIHQQGRLPADEALAMISQVASGLAEAHQNGLIHRDIKPANIMFEKKSGKAMLADFGLVKSTNSMHGSTQAGTVMGTADYMSPEQAQGHPVDARSDLYSLGAALYHLIVGKAPFQGETVTSIVYQHVHETPPSPSSLVPKLDRQVEAIVERLLAKDPDERYQSAESLIRDIEAVQTGGSISEPEAGTGFFNWRTGLMAAVAVLLLGTGAYWWQSAVPKLNTAVQSAPRPVEKEPAIEQPAESPPTPMTLMRTVGTDTEGPQIVESDDMLDFIHFLDLEADCDGSNWRKEEDQILLDDPTSPHRLAVPVRLTEPYDIEVHYRSVKGNSGAKILFPVGAVGRGQLRVGFNHGDGIELVGVKGSAHSDDLGPTSDPSFSFEPDTTYRIMVWVAVLSDGRAAITVQVNEKKVIRRKRFPGEFQNEAKDENHIAGQIPMIQGIGEGPVVFSKIGIEFNGKVTNLIRSQSMQRQQGKKRTLHFTGERVGSAYARSLEYDGTFPVTCEAWLTPEKKKFSHVLSMCSLSNVGMLTLSVSDDLNWRFRYYNHHSKKMYAATSPAEAVFGERVHVAGVYDNKLVRLFVNGKFVDESKPFDMQPKGKLLRIGADFYTGGNNHFYQGEMHQVRISKGVRYQKDFEPKAKLESDPTTWVLYDLNEGGGFLLNDSSGNGHHAIGRKLGWRANEGESAKAPDSQ